MSNKKSKSREPDALLVKLGDGFYTKWTDQGVNIVRKGDGRTWRNITYFYVSQSAGAHYINSYERYVNVMDDHCTLIKSST